MNPTVIFAFVILGNFMVANCITVGYSDNADLKVTSYDSHLLIQSAINFAKNNDGIVQLENGTYYISSNLNLYNNIKLTGAGVYDTTLRLIDGSSDWNKSGIVRASNASSIHVSHLTLDGNKYAQSNTSLYGKFGMYFEDTNYIYIDDVRIINWQGYGMLVNSVSNTYNIVVKNSVFQNNIDGLLIDNSTNAYISNNSFLANMRHGLNIVNGSSTLYVYDNIVSGNGFMANLSYGGCGIRVWDNATSTYTPINNIYIFNNTISYNKKADICVEHVTNTMIYNNTLQNSTVCVYNVGGVFAAFSNNTCSTYVQPVVASPEPSPKPVVASPKPVVASPEPVVAPQPIPEPVVAPQPTPEPVTTLSPNEIPKPYNGGDSIDMSITSFVALAIMIAYFMM
jgi:hypothetical protein